MKNNLNLILSLVLCLIFIMGQTSQCPVQDSPDYPSHDVPGVDLVVTSLEIETPDQDKLAWEAPVYVTMTIRNRGTEAYFGNLPYILRSDSDGGNDFLCKGFGEDDGQVSNLYLGAGEETTVSATLQLCHPSDYVFQGMILPSEDDLFGYNDGMEKTLSIFWEERVDLAGVDFSCAYQTWQGQNYLYCQAGVNNIGNVPVDADNVEVEVACWNNTTGVYFVQAYDMFEIMKPGQSTYYGFNFGIQDGEYGIYTCREYVDSKHILVEVDDPTNDGTEFPYNNLMYLNEVVVGRPDFVYRNFEVNVEVQQEASAYIFEVDLTMENVGQVAAEITNDFSFFSCYVYYPDETFEYYPVGFEQGFSLEVGSGARMHFFLSPGKALVGFHAIGCTIDAANHFEELNDADNSTARWVYLQ